MMQRVIQFCSLLLSLNLILDVQGMERSYQNNIADDTFSRLAFVTTTRTESSSLLAPQPTIAQAIDHQALGLFQQLLQQEFSKFKSEIIRIIKTYYSTFESREIDRKNTHKALVEYILSAFNQNAQTSIARSIGRYERPLDDNLLRDCLLAEGEQVKATAQDIISYAVQTSKFFRPLAKEQSRFLWNVVHYGHIIGLPVLVILYTAFLLYRPIRNSDADLLLSELPVLAVPVYVCTVLYFALFMAKYCATGSAFRRFDQDAASISDMLNEVTDSLDKLRDKLSDLVTKMVQPRILL